MDSEEIERHLSETWEGTLRAITVVRNAFQQEFTACEGNYSDGTATMKNLTLYMSDRSQAVSALAQQDYLWDAEIVLRSFYECAARIWFLGFQPAAEREKLAKEFLTELDYSHNRKAAQKAAYANSLSRNYQNAGESRILEALQNEKIFHFGEHNRKERKEIESRWSFYAILDSLGRRNEISIVELKSLLHMYGMMSHLIHADQKAIDLVVDEIARPADERRLLRAVHFQRIMSDLISIWTFSYASFRYALGCSPNIPDEIKDNWENATTLGEPLSDAFHDSQKSFYDRVLRSEVEG